MGYPLSTAPTDCITCKPTHCDSFQHKHEGIFRFHWKVHECEGEGRSKTLSLNPGWDADRARAIGGDRGRSREPSCRTRGRCILKSKPTSSIKSWPREHPR